MKPFQQLLLAMAGAGLVAPLAASANELASLTGSAAINEYMQQQDLDRFRAWEAKNQVTSVGQFSDVQPSDWAYQALSNLVEKYGCAAGYPNGTFKGRQAMTRYEAAALLNACLDRVTEKTEEIEKLLAEFDNELTVLTSRVDGLESKVGQLQSQQFSTTTKLKGEASMILGGIPGYESVAYIRTPKDILDNVDKEYKTRKKQGRTTFNYDIRLNFDTSFSGSDLLRTRLRTGNFSALPFGSSAQPFKLDKAEDWADSVIIDRLYYTFPVLKDQSVKLTVGALVRNTELAWIPTAYKSDILDFFALAGASGTYNKATGAGFGFQWKQPVEKGKPFWVFNTNYVVSGRTCSNSSYIQGAPSGTNSLPGGSCASKNGGSASDSEYGVFESVSGINALAQIGYKAPNWGASVGYRYGTTGSQTRDGNGLAGAALLRDQTSNSVALNAYWQPLKTGWIPSVSAGWSYNGVSGEWDNGFSAASEPSCVDGLTGLAVKLCKSDGPKSSASWFVGFQWDDAFVKGNAAGVAFGQPPFSSAYKTPGKPVNALQDNPWLIEWYYRFQVSDNLSITPSLFYGTGISTNRSASGGGGGTDNGSKASVFDGLGGVVQATFKF